MSIMPLLGRRATATKLPMASKTIAGRRPVLTKLLLAGMVALATSPDVLPARAVPSSRYVAEEPFIDANRASMAKMAAGMAIKPTGNIDHDFVAMMLPHHLGAIDMAQAELRYGHNQQLLRISQEIIASQLQEIAAMHIVLGDKVSASAAILAGSQAKGAAATMPVPRQSATAAAAFLRDNAVAMDRMMAAMAVTPSGDVDRDFVAMMVPHHQGAIDMAQAELRYGHGTALRRIAQEIIVDETQQITLMRLAVHETPPQPAPSPSNPAPAAAATDAGNNVPTSMQMSPLPSLLEWSIEP